jgi:CHRD domain
VGAGIFQPVNNHGGDTKVRRLILTVVGAVGVLALLGGLAQARPEAPPSPKKTAICHKTSSQTKPYVRLVVGTRALKAHMKHAGDIIPAPAGGCPTTVLSADGGGRKLTASLTGAAEVPGPGDSDGAGSAAIRLNHGQGQVCFRLSVSNLTLPATAAHVHRGAAGQAGPPVVTLTAPDATGSSSGCVTASRELVKEILKNASGFYVNVHTTDFSDGAVRGQLSS